MTIVVGENRFYKTSKGRGRPFVGEVVKNLGIAIIMKNLRTGEEMRVQPKFIGKPYEFKPYETKAKKLEAVELSQDLKNLASEIQKEQGYY